MNSDHPPIAIEAIVTDLDGTLLNSRKEISPENRAALLAARAAGISCLAASARPWRLITTVLGDDVELFDAVIVSNGAATITVATGQVGNEALIETDDLSRLIYTLRTRWPDAGFGWELGTVFQSDARFRDIARGQRVLRDVDAPVVEMPAFGVHQLVMAKPDAHPAEFIAEVQREIGDDHIATDSDGGVLEISAASTSKASSAGAWLSERGSGLDAVLAFGDEHNDIPLLAAAGLSFAMANASPAAQRAADHLAPSNDDNGVAVVIRRILAGDRDFADLSNQHA